MKYTEEELKPYTDDKIIGWALANIFCVGTVKDQENTPGFLGWVVCGQRPMTLCRVDPIINAVVKKDTTTVSDRDIEKVMKYGSVATIFPTYGEALIAVADTWIYAHQYGLFSWFSDAKLRVFSVGSPK